MCSYISVVTTSLGLKYFASKQKECNIVGLRRKLLFMKWSIKVCEKSNNM